MRALYIFDIDGTVANIEHRVHKLKEIDNPDRWDEFYSMCDKDVKNMPVIETLNRILASGAEVYFFTGRVEAVRDKTEKWLLLNLYIGEVNLTMRPDGNYTPDHLLKDKWYNSMFDVDKKRLVAVFDDRQSVVDMWRSNNVACFQVAPGNF